MGSRLENLKGSIMRHLKYCDLIIRRQDDCMKNTKENLFG